MLSATYLATTTTYYLHSTPLLHLLMPRRSEHDTAFATSFPLDWHTPPFGAKQGIPTRQSIQLIDGLYRFRKSIPSITSLYKPSSTYSCDDTVTWRSPPSAVNVKSNKRTSLHNSLLPLATVTVSTAPSDGCASVVVQYEGEQSCAWHRCPTCNSPTHRYLQLPTTVNLDS